MEALLGAVHIEHGIDTAREVVLRLFLPLLTASSSMGAGLDWKTSLQELAAERDLGAPAYRITSTGPDHDKEFTAVAVVDENDLGEGVGRTKKEAEQKAAAAAWKSLDVNDSETSDDDAAAVDAAASDAEQAPESA